MPDAVFWRSTPHEVATLLERLVKRQRGQERAATLRAGLIASAIYNTNRTKRSQKVWRPQDFLAEPVRPQSELHDALRRWAESIKRSHEA